MTVTKEQWAEIVKELSYTLGRVELKCDGYKIDAAVEQIATFKQGITVYVNGQWRGKWMRGECEEARKFHREKKTFLHSAAKRAEFVKTAKKRGMPADLREWYAKSATASISFWLPYWTNARALTRHLRKTCTEIRVVKIGERQIEA